MKHMEGAKKRKGWRQALALLITLVLVCGLAAPAYAENAAENAVTVQVSAGGSASVRMELPQGTTFTVTPEDSGLDFTVEDGTVTVSAPEDAAVGTYQVTASGEIFEVQVVAPAQGELDLLSDDEHAQQSDGDNLDTIDDEQTDGNQGNQLEEPVTPKTAEPLPEEPETESETKPLIDQLMDAQTCTEMAELLVADMEKTMTLDAVQLACVREKAAGVELTEGEDASVKEYLLEMIDALMPPEESETTEEVNADDFGIEPYSVGGYASVSVKVGEEATIDSNVTNGSSHGWKSNNEDIAKVINTSNSGASATVRGVSAGTATITHSYSTGGWLETEKATETITVIITEGTASTGTKAAVYLLKSPTSDPDSNAINQWGSGIAYAVVNVDGVKWSQDGDGNDKNLFNKDDPLADNILSWPAGGTVDAENGTWTITNNGTYPETFQEVYDYYRTQLQTELGITGLQLSDITSITLHPYKISKDNGGTYPVHIDCKITITCTKAYTAIFKVQMPGDAGYTEVDKQTLEINNNVADRVPESTYSKASIEKGGFTYEFDGWYDEAGNKVDTWPHAPTEEELSDGAVEFTAHYVLKPASMTIKKKFSGLPNGVATPQVTVTVTGGENYSKTVLLNAEYGYTATLNDLNPTVEYTVTENTVDLAAIDGYTWKSVTYSQQTIKPSQNRTNEVTVTNTYEPSTTTVTVSKNVTGGLGDRTKNFGFAVTVQQNGADAEFKLDENTYRGSARFTLSNGNSVTLTVPVGSTVTVTEDNYGDGEGGYTTTYKVNSGESEPGLEASLAAAADGNNTITFTNHKEASPDTGVILDSLPYVLILGAVAVVAVVMVSRKRRDRDAD